MNNKVLLFLMQKVFSKEKIYGFVAGILISVFAALAGAPKEAIQKAFCEAKAIELPKIEAKDEVK